MPTTTYTLTVTTDQPTDKVQQALREALTALADTLSPWPTPPTPQATVSIDLQQTPGGYEFHVAAGPANPTPQTP